MNKKVSFVIFDTMEDVSYENYVENCNINNIAAGDENSQDYYNYISNLQKQFYEDAMYDISNADDLNVPCIITGTLGLWNGNPTIYPQRDESVHDAIERCWGRDIDDMKVFFEDGVFYVKAYHHDGTNCFEIHKLTAAGIKATEDWYRGCKECELKDKWLGKFKYQ